MDVWRDCDEVRVLDEGMDVNVRCERVDVWRDCDEVRVLDEWHDDECECENVSEWMYGGIVMR